MDREGEEYYKTRSDSDAKRAKNKKEGMHFVSPVVILSVESSNEVDRLARVAL